MRAFVTGGTGFVGSHLVEALRARGDEVTALVRTPAKASLLTELGATLVPGDLHTMDALRRGLDGADVAYHVAGAVAAFDEAAYLRGNRDGTTNILRAAEAAGTARFVLVSSMAAGGPSRPGRARHPDDAPNPVTAYGRSKLAGEQVVRGGGVPWVIVRPPTVYGPRDRDNFLALFRIARRGVAPVFGDGSQELSAVYAPDLAAGIVAAGITAGIESRTYYVNHPEVVTSAGVVRQVAAVMGRRVRIIPLPAGVARTALRITGAAARATGRPTILNADKANEFLQAAWTGDVAPFVADTGWRAEHDLAAGLTRTWEWYRAHGWL